MKKSVSGRRDSSVVQLRRWSPIALLSLLTACCSLERSGNDVADTAPSHTAATPAPADAARSNPALAPRTSERVVKTDAEWRRFLTSAQYEVTRNKGTERAFTGQYWDHKAAGTYACVCCDLDLFDSSTKFESGTGWPSFWQPIAADRLREHGDGAFGMVRTEIVCSRCEAHLGHVFDDGPQPTRLRYCINSVALRFRARP